MNYYTSKDISIKWGVSERSVRDYCIKGRVPGAYLDGKIWKIPENSKKPERQARVSLKNRTLLEVLREEKENKTSGGIYHSLQIDMTYNSNHIEGSKLTHDETRYIFETQTISASATTKVNDIIETVNHFKCIDIVIDLAKAKLTESMIKQLHYVLKANTMDSRNKWFRVGDYKTLPNQVGGNFTTDPKNVKQEMQKLLNEYNSKNNIAIEDIIEFHKEFERIHPFQDGNGRVGRLIMLKECLKYGYVPIVILDELKNFYYNGLQQWDTERGYLIDTCLYGQDIMKKVLDKYNINYW